MQGLPDAGGFRALLAALPQPAAELRAATAVAAMCPLPGGRLLLRPSSAIVAHWTDYFAPAQQPCHDQSCCTLRCSTIHM